MKPDNHEERQKELEQAFQQNQTNASPIKNQQQKLKSQAELVEMSGMLFDINENKPFTNQIVSTPSQSYQSIPMELQQAQQAVQQAQLNLLNENQQLQQALYQLHQAQENVRQIQMKVQQAQQQVQITQATANSIVNNYAK